MKKILIFLLTFICLKSFSQSTVLLRGDTIRVYKQGDSAYMKVDSFLFVAKQVVIGKTYLPLKTSVSLYLSDTTRAFRTNKMWSRFNIVTPENGMQIYEDSTDQFLCYQASAWGACGGGGVNIYNSDGRLTGNRVLGGAGYNLQIGDSIPSLSLFSGNDFVSTGIGSSIQMSDSVMTLQSSSATDFTSFVFSPTRIKFTAADGAGSAGDVWTNTGSGYGHWATGGGSGTINSGTTGKPAYYVGATTLDDFAAIDYATSGTNMLLTTQNTTDVGLNIKGQGSQTANLLNISSSAGTGDLGSWTKDGYTKTNRLGLPASVSPSYSLDIQDANTGVTSLQISDPGGGQYRLKIREYGTYIDGYSSVMQVYNAYTAGRLNLGGYNVGDQLALFGTYITVKNRFNEAQGADVASAAGAIALGTGGNTFEITGTSAITLISNDLWQNGSIVTLAFTSTATLVDGTANSGTDIGLELTGNTNFIASAGETVTLRLMEIGGTQRWREIGRSVEVGSTSTLQKGFFLESPGSAEAVDMWQTPVAITVTSLKAILRGSSPSVTYNVKFGTDITSATDVFTAAITCTSVTTGCSNNSGFNDATIPAGSFIWIVTTASSGTINSISWTINYTED
jgi:hypothetical protein